jgi:hypothetical protein
VDGRHSLKLADARGASSDALSRILGDTLGELLQYGHLLIMLAKRDIRVTNHVSVA